MNLINLIKPEVVFLSSILLAISPYALWSIYGENDYNVEINYEALVVWLCGFIFFIIGAFLARKKNQSNVLMEEKHLGNIKKINNFLLFFWLIQTLGVIYIYGGIPIVKYLLATSDVSAANSSQLDGFIGQFGLYTLTNFILISNLSFQILIRKAFNKKNLDLRIILNIVIISFGLLIAGKRQGIVIMFLFIFVSYILFQKVQNIKEIKLKMKKRNFFILAILIFIIFGQLGKVRTQGENNMSSQEQLMTYLQYPLINLEWQLSNFGMNPEKFNFAPILSGFVPYKLLVTDPDSDFGDSVYGFRYPAYGIGAGLYGPVHLAGGLYGIALFSIFLGYFTKSIYIKSCHNWKWIPVYALTIWPLFSSHSYNHFTSIIFYWTPLFFFMIINIYYTKTGKRK